MLKKRDKAREFLEANSSLFRCPLCHEATDVNDYTLTCRKNHQFELSKKGTLYFLKTHTQTEYNQKMFSHRQAMIKSGMYKNMLAAVLPQTAEGKVILDVGCGEGSFLSELAFLGMEGTKIGFDISKEGVYLASNQPIDAFWCAADLTNLPFADQSVDCILNIFSPSHYGEFQRVLTPKGRVIKIIPEEGYLKELRAGFFPEDLEKQHYSNLKVVEKFSQSMKLIENQRITTIFDVPQERRLDLLEMSPLEWQATTERKAQLQENPLEEITVDLRMLIGEIR
ncbi:methyltransferase domain-containing protein [Enterococcus sp. LJL51]|uniref:methyltransferase domain-containing protein n=1 Tax=Enterococcus sp. LJL51 TaxID=3416656 RepID=UPI003CF17962